VAVATTLPSSGDWLAAYLRVQRAVDRKVLIILRDSMADIDAMLLEMSRRPSGIGRMVRQEQLRTVQRELLRQLSEIYRQVGLVVEAGRLDAARAAIQLNGVVNSVMFGSVAGDAVLGRALTEAMGRTALMTMDAATARMLANPPVGLSKRITTSEAWIKNVLDRKINSALARGLSVKEFAKEVKQFYRPDTPGGMRYASLRLARTEVNAAYHHTARMQVIDAPWVPGQRWYLSGSHPKADVCDPLAKEDHDDLGEGVFKPANVPNKPHPQCFCYIAPVVVQEDVFLDNLLKGRYDDYIRRTTGVA
jgi:hypothetical protein